MSLLGVGIDQAWDRASPADLLAYGATFVCRYLGEDNTGKNLTAGEAAGYIAAGIAIVSNYEYNPGGYLSGYNEGVRVARLADAQHRACGGPPDRPIYFSVDKQVLSAADMGAVRDYARGIADVIGVARTGIYAQYSVIAELFDRGEITYGWQTYAWSGQPTQWDPRAQIRQVANGVQVAGHDVDRDEQWSTDFGQWGVDMGATRAERIIEGWSQGFETTTQGEPIGPVSWVKLQGGQLDHLVAAAADITTAANAARDAAQAAASRPQAAVSPVELADALIGHPKFAQLLQAAVTGAISGSRLEVHTPPF